MYPYNVSRQTTTVFLPSELIVGRRQRTPNELLRTERVESIGNLMKYPFAARMAGIKSSGGYNNNHVATNCYYKFPK